jgi:hypothetical protein
MYSIPHGNRLRETTTIRSKLQIDTDISQAFHATKNGIFWLVRQWLLYEPMFWGNLAPPS